MMVLMGIGVFLIGMGVGISVGRRSVSIQKELDKRDIERKLKEIDRVYPVTYSEMDLPFHRINEN